MTNLASFSIPTDFILSRVMPSAAELAYGFRAGRVSAEQLVEIEEAKVQGGHPTTHEELQLAKLLPTELDEVEDIVARIETKEPERGDEFRVWLFLTLAWLLERRESIADPLAVVEMIFEDFDHPSEIYGLIRYMPVGPSEPRGLDAVFQRWIDYVHRSEEEFRRRSAKMVSDKISSVPGEPTPTKFRL
jgi:hypothetical protein